VTSAIHREIARALRAGDIALAEALSRVVGAVRADEVRRMTRAELAALEPELAQGCHCGGSDAGP
jgi:hypothetical protein